jgi:hypothetical protein
MAMPLEIRAFTTMAALSKAFFYVTGGFDHGLCIY